MVFPDAIVSEPPLLSVNVFPETMVHEELIRFPATLISPFRLVIPVNPVVRSRITFAPTMNVVFTVNAVAPARPLTVHVPDEL